jgi:hypothetical protein
MNLCPLTREDADAVAAIAEFWRRGLTRATLGVDSESSLLTHEKALR